MEILGWRGKPHVLWAVHNVHTVVEEGLDKGGSLEQPPASHPGVDILKVVVCVPRDQALGEK